MEGLELPVEACKPLPRLSSKFPKVEGYQTPDVVAGGDCQGDAAPNVGFNEEGREDEQRLVQIPLSKPMMPPTRCRVPDGRLRCFEINFQAVEKWTESML
jgi:hypothetical protein